MRSNADDLINESVTTDSTASTSWTAALADELVLKSEAYVETPDGVEYWGTTDEGWPWRVYLAHGLRAEEGPISGWHVVDPRGGVWWPDDDAEEAIEAAADPAAAAVAIATAEPYRGTWRQ
jgi:hypothetical protein